MHRKALERVARWLADTRSTGDPGPVLDPRALADARELWETLGDGEEHLQALYTLGWLHWYRYTALPEGSDQEDLEAVGRAFVPCYLAGLDDLPEPLVPHLAEAAAPAALELLEEALIGSASAEETAPAPVSLWQRIVDDLGPEHSGRPECLFHLGLALRVRFMRTQDPDILRRAVLTLEEAERAAPPGRPQRPGTLLNLALCLWSRFNDTGTRADLDRAVELLREAVHELPGDAPDRPAYLHLQATVLHGRHSEDGSPDDLEGAITALAEAVRLTDAGTPVLPQLLHDLGTLLLTRVDDTGDVRSAHHAADVLQRAVRATPHDDPNRLARLSDHALARRQLVVHTGAADDLRHAIEALTEAVGATPSDDPDRAWLLSGLATTLSDRFDSTGSAADLTAALEAAREAVRLTGDDHPDRLLVLGSFGAILQLTATRADSLPELDEAFAAVDLAASGARPDDPAGALLLTNLASTLVNRYIAFGDPADVDRAVTTARQAVRIASPTDPERATYLSNLGTALLARYNGTDQRALLTEAVEALRETAADTPHGHFARPQRLSNLGTALFTRYLRGGDPHDADDAVDAVREAVRTTPAGHTNRGLYLSNLGAVFHARFTRTGSAGDLDDAVDTLRAAVRDTPADYLHRGRHLSNLGAALLARSGMAGSRGDLDEAVSALREAPASFPDGHIHRAVSYSNLAHALQRRATATDSPADLDEAVTAARNAVRIAPDDLPDRASYLAGLGTALGRRFDRSGDPQDNEEAIGVLREAVRAVADNHPHRSECLANLGEALHTRFGVLGDPVDLSESIAMQRAALTAAAEGHPELAVLWSNLALALRDESERTGDPADRLAAAQAWRNAWESRTAAPSVRIQAARSLIGQLAESDPAQAAEIAEAAVLLLPEVAPRQLERGERQHAVGEFEGLTGAAAALVLTAGHGTEQERALRALRLLETGRSVLLSQGMDVRSDLSDLRAEHPRLAARYTELRELLDRPAFDVPPAMMTGTDSGAIPDYASGSRAAPDRSLPAREFAALTAAIRAQPGFETFARPPSTEELLATAATDPVVVVNLSFQRCDALLLTGDGATCVELPDLIGETLVDQVNAFRDALADSWHAATASQRRHAQQTMSRVLEWLWDVVAGPVLEALGHRHEPPPGAAWPRLWWAPGGFLSLLPLHAAGHHTDTAADPGRRTVMDRVVSSYTPTVRALRHAREQGTRASTGPSRPGRGLVVAMPTTPGLPHGRLSHAVQEAEKACALLPDVTLLREEPGRAAADPDAPTKANVLDRLPGCAFAHFVCHGRSHPQDPSRSMLLLHDHEQDPFTVAGLAPLVLDGAQLAYLSACSTAGADVTDVIDEAIHLASAFQLAGFPHVIGTLWEIDDQVAVTVATAFYDGLRTDNGELDPARAASALHHAVRAVRDGADMAGPYDRTRAPFLWAAYLHAGA